MLTEKGIQHSSQQQQTVIQTLSSLNWTEVATNDGANSRLAVAHNRIEVVGYCWTKELLSIELLR